MRICRFLVFSKIDNSLKICTTSYADALKQMDDDSVMTMKWLNI